MLRYATDISCSNDKNMLARLITPNPLNYDLLESCNISRECMSRKTVKDSKHNSHGSHSKQIKNMLSIFSNR